MMKLSSEEISLLKRLFSAGDEIVTDACLSDTDYAKVQRINNYEKIFSKDKKIEGKHFVTLTQATFNFLESEQ